MIKEDKKSPDLARLSLPLLPRNRSGSHVGMMLSFLIFVTFIAFLYSVFRPAIKFGEDKNSILESVEMEIIKNTSTNLTVATISTSQGAKDCIRLSLFFTLMQDVMPIAEKGATVIVKNSLNEEQNSYNNVLGNADTDLRIDRMQREKNDFFKVYYSTKFPKLGEPTSSISCTTLYNQETPPKYTIGAVTTSKYIFETDMVNLRNRYTNEYETLKEYLKIPEGNDFWFSFIKSDGSSISPQEKEIRTTSIFSDEIPIQYVNENADIQSGFINIKVW